MQPRTSIAWLECRHNQSDLYVESLSNILNGIFFYTFMKLELKNTLERLGVLNKLEECNYLKQI